MNAKNLILALNEIDDRYLQEAMAAEAAPVTKRAPRRAAYWAAAAACCVCLVSAAAFLWRLTAVVPQGTVQPESGGQVHAASSELPELNFTADKNPSSACLAGPPDGSVTRALTSEEIASIWGQKESLTWEGVPPLERYLVNADVILDPEGKVWEVRIWGYSSDEAQKNHMDAFQIVLCPDKLPAECVATEDESQNSDVWGTQVAALVRGGARGYGSKDESGSYFSDITRYRTEFLRTDGETVGVRAEMTADELGLTDDEARDLLTRFTSQSLRTGETLQLSQLAQGE